VAVENIKKIKIPFKDIKTIFERIGIEPEEVCYYPDKTRAKLEEE
jgi:hypothetical protein